ncbi:MAG TPA: hypothetical protein VH417_03820 [Vicinamibacterales bacterium]|jgi:hypothetical protein
MKRPSWPAAAVLRIVCGALIGAHACAGAVYADEPPDFTVIINVQNEAPVARWLLGSAEQETGRVFRQFGVDLQWRESRRAASDDVQAPEVSIVLMSAAMGARKSKTDHVADTTLAIGSRRTGRSYVFCDRVAATARQHALSEDMVLAHAFMHELGHMIANVGHDAHGIMRESLELRAAGFFGFTAAQIRAMRSALADAAATDAPRLALRLAPELAR